MRALNFISIHVSDTTTRHRQTASRNTPFHDMNSAHTVHRLSVVSHIDSKNVVGTSSMSSAHISSSNKKKYNETYMVATHVLLHVATTPGALGRRASQPSQIRLLFLVSTN